MQVLWWLVPAVAAMCLAMVWATWAGRSRGEVRRDDSPAAMRRMERALRKPLPRKATAVRSAYVEPSRGVALRRSTSSPRSAAEPPR